MIHHRLLKKIKEYENSVKEDSSTCEGVHVFAYRYACVCKTVGFGMLSDTIDSDRYTAN